MSKWCVSVCVCVCTCVFLLTNQHPAYQLSCSSIWDWLIVIVVWISVQSSAPFSNVQTQLMGGLTNGNPICTHLLNMESHLIRVWIAASRPEMKLFITCGRKMWFEAKIRMAMNWLISEKTKMTGGRKDRPKPHICCVKETVSFHCSVAHAQSLNCTKLILVHYNQQNQASLKHFPFVLKKKLVNST